MPGHGRQRRPAAVREGPADHEQDARPGDDDQHDRSGREPRKLPRRNHTATITARARPDNPYRISDGLDSWLEPAGDPITLTGIGRRAEYLAEARRRPR